MKHTKRSRGAVAIKVIGIILLIFIGLLAAVVLGFRAYMMLPVSAYYAASEQAFEIPGLDADFVPQGFCYDEANGFFLISGYSSEKEASSVYLVDRASGETVKQVRLLKETGDKFTGHAGGVALYGDRLYIAGGSGHCLYVYAYADLLAAADGGTAKRLGKFSLALSDDDYMGASFVTVHDGKIIVGEFYAEPDYPSLDSHKLTTGSGERHGALAVEFALSPDAEFGIDPTPLCAYSICDKVQGICFDGGKIYLSTSLGLSHSYIYAYDQASVVSEGEIELIGHTVPLYALDAASLEDTYKLPPMAEELVMLDGRMYVMCESACSKYFFGKLIDAKWCYSTDLGAMNRR